MPRLRDPRQIDIFDWTPPSATIIRHPAVFRAVWRSRLPVIASRMVESAVYAENLRVWGPMRLGEQLARMGATEHEIAREVSVYQRELIVELAKREQGDRFGPGAA